MDSHTGNTPLPASAPPFRRDGPRGDVGLPVQAGNLSPITRGVYDTMSLRTKFLATVGLLSLLPVIFIAIHITSGYDSLFRLELASVSDPGARLAAEKGAHILKTTTVLLTIVTIALILIGTFFAERLMIGQIRSLLAWIVDARKKKFSEFPAMPISSHDELGQLGAEMRESISYFQGVEAREKEILEQKTEFISIAAHQLRTPMTGLRWGIETVLSDTTTVEKRKTIGVGLSATVERIIHLIDDLLDVTKIEEGKFGYIFGQTDLTALLQKIIAHFDLIAQSKNVSLTMHGGALPSVYIDHNRIEIALSNLLSNAIDFTPRGGSVLLEAKEEDGRVVLMVRDTGIGIPPEYLPKLFTKFSRAENAVRLRPDGSGLGLYLAQNVVKHHGSEITVESDIGKGSVFSFTLPKSKEDLEQTKPSVDAFFGSF
ncbi:MAG: HAMP domain-containing sensor histidine kinase [bacterium]|nr:HAMP domain-containing sensor histidine kinase [bacterium]